MRCRCCKGFPTCASATATSDSISISSLPYADTTKLLAAYREIRPQIEAIYRASEPKQGASIESEEEGNVEGELGHTLPPWARGAGRRRRRWWSARRRMRSWRRPAPPPAASPPPTKRKASPRISTSLWPRRGVEGIIARKSGVGGRGCVSVEDGRGVHHEHLRRLTWASRRDLGAPAPHLLDLDAPEPRELR